MGESFSGHSGEGSLSLYHLFYLSLGHGSDMDEEIANPFSHRSTSERPSKLNDTLN